MRLYTSPATPFGRKVMALILELGLEDRIEISNVMGTPLAPGSLPVDQNPLGKIPALQTDAGGIYDSRVICRYLNDLAGGALYPTGPAIWPPASPPAPRRSSPSGPRPMRASPTRWRGSTIS